MLFTLVLFDVAGQHGGLAGDSRILDGEAGTLIPWILVPVVGLVLSSGLWLAAGTPWGLTQHWWLLGKTAIAAVLTTIGLALILAHVASPAARIGGVLALTTATVLSVLKPWGRTRRRTPRHRLSES
jgi:hypothetical protein